MKHYPLAAALAALIALSGCGGAAVLTPSAAEPVTPAATIEPRPTDAPTLAPTEAAATAQPAPTDGASPSGSAAPANHPAPADSGPAAITAPPPFLTGGVLTGTAYIEHIAVTVSTSSPIQVTVDLKGSLPDGCTHIASIGQSFDAPGKTFTLTVKTARPLGMMCTEALVPYEKTVSLPVSGLPAGTYTVKASEQSATFELSAAVP